MSIIFRLFLSLARSRLWLLLLPLAGRFLPFVGWMFDGLMRFFSAVAKGAFGILSSWQNVLATLVVCTMALAGGIRIGVWATSEVAEIALGEMRVWRTAHDELLAQARAVDQQDEERFNAAVLARAEAIAAERIKAARGGGDKAIAEGTQRLKGTGDPVLAKRPAGGVRKPAAKSKAPSSADFDLGQGLQGWIYSVFGGPVEAKPKRPRVGGGA